MNKTTTFLTALICVLMSFSVAKASVDDLINAMRHVESNDDSAKVGDNGHAIGILQIHYDCWQDATEFDPTIGGSYADCQDKDYAAKIVMAYWRRYASKALANNDYETLARIWNGGPHGNRKQATIAYWIKVKASM